MKSNVKPIPDGYHTVIPYLVVEDVAKLMEFLSRAFNAKEVHRSALPDGSIMHAEMKVRDSPVMMGGARDPWKPRPTTLYLYVEDVDAVFRQAIEAGGKSLQEPKDQFYGDRSGGVEDPCGNFWFLATHIEDVSHDEIERRFAAMGHQH